VTNTDLIKRGIKWADRLSAVGVSRPVLQVPDSALKVVAQACDDIDDGILSIAADLVATMRSHPRCVGLAAPQIGKSVRIIAMDVTGHPKATAAHGPLVLINPVICFSAGQKIGREGCLSAPSITANIRRAVHILVVALSPTGEVVVQTSGFEARVLQHEMDHLDGILILDRVTSAADIFPRKPSRPKSNQDLAV
jgi:peptide deformylase